MDVDDDAKIWVSCGDLRDAVIPVITGVARRATEGVIRFWELRGPRNGLVKINDLLAKKATARITGFIVTGATFDMRIMVDYESAGRVAYRQYFGIRCTNWMDDYPVIGNRQCHVLELGPNEYTRFFDSLGKKTTSKAIFLGSSFDDIVVKQLVDSWPVALPDLNWTK